MSNIVPISFCSDTTEDDAALYEFIAVKGFTIVGISHGAQGHDDATSVELGILDDTVSKISVSQPDAGTIVTWKSTDVGGANAPVHIDADSVVALSLTTTVGSGPTITGWNATLFVKMDE